MLLLSIDSSAVAASAAITQDDQLLGEFFVNIKQTHSQTLMPMVQDLLASTHLSCAELDAMAVSVGPGSFTGVRIGVASVKGMALSRETPCCGVSTLEAIAWNGAVLRNHVLCAVMDARCGQVYNALFTSENGELHRLCEDRALSIEQLAAETAQYGEALLLLGDGAALCHRSLAASGAQLAPEAMRYQRASSVAAAARRLLAAGKAVSPADLVPCYLRLPQAERELRKKQSIPNRHGLS